MDVESAARDMHALPGLVVLISVPLVVTILSLARLSSSLVLGSGSGPREAKSKGLITTDQLGHAPNHGNG
ncbi:hypothetical protein PLIIFM63780_010248 [Purpureocillium lilacinum]|nr:hypothetical protein PLIIFM63780_010248 [Purpureocillium lilacinum]